MQQTGSVPYPNSFVELLNIGCANHFDTRRSVFKQTLCFENYNYNSEAVRRLGGWGTGCVAELRMRDEDSCKNSEG